MCIFCCCGERLCQNQNANKLKQFYFPADEKPEKVEKPKEDGPPPDPSTAKIAANKESIIEINASNKGLGLFVAGGKMVTPPIVSESCL